MSDTKEVAMSTSEAAPSFEAEAAANVEESKDDKEAPAAAAAGGDAASAPPPAEEKVVPEEPVTKPVEEDLGDPIQEPAPMDVLTGRGAAVNSHPGNKKFRALCFVRKPLFDAGNQAVKRRIATEIVHLMTKPKESDVQPTRFLKKAPKGDKGPYYEMTEAQAISKAQQVMRDYKRPDRIAMRESLEASGQLRKRNRTTVSTPIDEPILEAPAEPIVENPFGVHEHDVLNGRGAYINSHRGNERLRALALERKKEFDRGTYSDKRKLATEIVHIIQQLDPPGRFLKKASPDKLKSEEDKTDEAAPELIDGTWEQLSEDKAIHKACQVMRDIARPDRKFREERKEERKRRKLAKANGLPVEPAKSNPGEAKEGESAKEGEAEVKAEEAKDADEKAAAAVEVVDNTLQDAGAVEI